MARISNTEAYPFKNVIDVNDFFVLTSEPESGRTRSATSIAVSNFVAANQNISFQYNYSDGSDSDVDSTDAGFFESRDNGGVITTDPTMSAQFRVNPVNASGTNLSQLYTILSGAASVVLLQVQGITNPNVVGLYAIGTITNNVDNFLINVSLPPTYSSSPPDGVFVHRDVYKLSFIPFQEAVQGAVPFGAYTVYKASGNANLSSIEVGDVVEGWFNSTVYFEQARYSGGDVSLIGSWEVIDSTDFS